MGRIKDCTRSRRARPFATRIARALAVGALVCLVTLLAYQFGQRAGIRSLESVAVSRLDVFRASFFSPIERYEYLPNLLAVHPLVLHSLRHGDDGAGRAALNAFLENANGMAKAASIYVMNPDGVTIAASNWNTPDSFVGKSFSFRPYFQEARRGGTGRFYGIGAVTGIPGYFLAQPVRHGGRIIGVIAVKADLDNLDQRWEFGADQIVVTDDSGIIFLSSNKEWKYRTTRPLSQEVLRRLRETRQYATTLKPPIAVARDPLWRQENVVLVRDEERAGGARRYLRLSHELSEAKWTITTYSAMDRAEETAAGYAFGAAGGMAFLLLLALYILQVRHRIAEQEAARKAADIAHEKLEAKHAELEMLSGHLKTMAISDPLTGCHNRRYFIEISAKMVSAAHRHRRRISVLMLDIDFFKKVNDTWGHPAGDEVLKAVARVCQDMLREPDFLVRFGGEEFVVILPDTGQEEAVIAAERLRTAVQQLEVPAAGTTLRVTVSIGIAEFGEEEPSLDKVLARADMALYHAKRGGRNRTFAYAAEMQAAQRAIPAFP